MSGERPCVLVADDQDDARLLVRRVLERAGYRVVEAVDGKEAIRQVRQERLGVVILDQQMPGMTGFEAAALADDPETAHVRTIISSVYVGRDDVGALQRRGVSAYLAKPFRAGDLRATVSGLAGDTPLPAVHCDV